MVTAFYVIIAFSAVIMAYNLFIVFKLKKKVPGGEVGDRTRDMSILITIFFLGYLTTPLLKGISENYKDLVVSSIFFLGAIFVFLVIRLLLKIIEIVGIE